MTDHPVMSACLLGFSSRLRGTGLSGAVETLAGERPTQAPAVAAAAMAYAFAAATNGAGSIEQQRHLWAFRGLEPWSHPA
ncbi:hypothetical protein IHE55_19760 [Streptomyces pactum]|uniref:Uncharacterized protein n=1 Tax=Streptomyces pactum TaxID=68249 RepID=A0ABS0NNU3_9ACTN|nr:hypothetical protein [Streptomyces pactum]MBH5336880.1 hypothetical protein [Streptomyces pactum]